MSSSSHPAAGASDSLEYRAVSELLILRSRWLEAITFDHRLTAGEARIGTGAICRYLNRDPEHGRFGMFWMSAARLAKDLVIHERTVQRALGRLPMLGYCEIVEPGGGRHKPAIYRPTLLETTEPAPPIDGETTAPRSRNYGTRIPETTAPALTNSSKRYNPVVVESGALGIAGQLRARIGDTKFRAWFTGVEVEGFSDGLLTLSAPTKFARTYIRANFMEDIADVGRRLHASFERAEVTVRS